MNRTTAIEDLLKHYGDVPREVVIKQDLLSFGQSFTEKALEAASKAEVKSYRLFSYDLVPMASMQRNEFRRIPEHFVIKGGTYGLRPVMVQSTISADSPYVIDVVDGRLKLCLDGAPIADVGYNSPMKYYSKSFPDGTAYRDIVAFGSFVTIVRVCQLWGLKEECKFCDINENARQMKKAKSSTLTAPVKKVEQIAEVVNEIGREVLESDGYPAPIHFVLTGGAITNKLNGSQEDEFYLSYVEAIKWGGPRRSVTLQTIAKDKETLKHYRSRGVDSHHANMEVWDEKLFGWICPGKTKKVGWQEWIKRTVDSVDVFGEGNVRPNFVCGVEMAQPYGFKTVAEAVKSTTEGIKFLTSHGVMPRFNQWRREPGAYLQKKYTQPPVPPEFYIELMTNYYENWKNYRLPLPRRLSAQKMLRTIGVGHGTYDDFLILLEEKDYEKKAYKSMEENGMIWGTSNSLP